jgi:protein-L-isoaspartate O-methyltransferase
MLKIQSLKCFPQSTSLIQSREGLAHADQPLKEGNVHISAPHIYGSALEALELRADSSLSFLNVGSGTGYVSSIVAAIMGPTSSNLGVEIFHDVVQHSQAAVATWKSSLNDPSRIPPMEVLQGNALNINPSLGEACRGFDRIYIGASVQQSDLSKLTCLLKPGGILVGPGKLLADSGEATLRCANSHFCKSTYSGRRTCQGCSHSQIRWRDSFRRGFHSTNHLRGSFCFLTDLSHH